jgi:hypothetical protein
MFAGKEQICIEYLHRAIMPEQATIAGSPPAGTEIAVPICITMHIKNGKFDKVDEYLDLATLSGVKQHLFSDTKPNSAPGTDIVQTITNAMTSDDIESMVNVFAPDGEWVIMATGETFRGHDQIRQLATRSVAARDHTAGVLADGERIHQPALRPEACLGRGAASSPTPSRGRARRSRHSCPRLR